MCQPCRAPASGPITTYGHHGEFRGWVHRRRYSLANVPDCTAIAVSGSPLPDFADPPVVETVLGVSFLEVPQLTSTQIVRFWGQHLADALPSDAERAPYNVPVERFPAPPPREELSVRLRVEPPPTRFMFSDDNHLVQIQSDWFAYNWRKTLARPDYERYEAGRERFQSHLEQFSAFLHEDLEARLQPVQCEITYVNHVALVAPTAGAGPLGAVLRDVQPTVGAYLPEPHHAEFSSQYEMHAEDVVGRLHVSARTAAVDRDSDALLVVLALTARGAPPSGDLSGVVRFLDAGRVWIVRGFEDLTTSQMQEQWGQKSKGGSP
ncbi:MAG: TIGR04255 family protein [bacterium]|nr:TIGR04255 family protein [bacterium]